MYSMNYIGKFISNFRDFYNEINTATLTGAIDVIVVEQPDGTYTCSPFHVRFGKLGVLRSREKVVDIEINGEPLDIHMKLGESGEAFFVEEIPADELNSSVPLPPHLACSPIPSGGFPSEAGFPARYLAASSAANDEWSRRRSNSEVIKRRPKETIDQTFAQDDIQEHKSNNDIEHDLVYEWLPESKSEAMGYGSAPEIANSESYSLGMTVAVSEVTGPNSGTFVPRTFKAETVDSSQCGEKTRKLSGVSGEFRPITDDVTQSSPPSDSVALVASGVETSITIATAEEAVEDGIKPATVSKRKRRKRSLMKKKGGNNNPPLQRKNSEASDTSASLAWESATSILSSSARHPEPTVFMMDDIDGPAQNMSTVSPDTMSAGNSPVDCKKTGGSDLSRDLSSLADELSRDLSKIQNASTESDFHFFSDTEILPGNGPDDEDSRPCSPIQSDTEFETTKRPGGSDSSRQTEGAGTGPQQSWRWGELPSPPPRLSGIPAPTGNTSSDDEGTKQHENAAAQKSMLSGMFSFMKKTKRIRHNPESEGIYLSELNVEELDPEVAALYFPTSYHRQGCPAPGECTPLQRDEDAESGNGPSLPQSPHSVEGAIGGPFGGPCGGPKSVDSDFEEPKHSFFENKSCGEISLSLCGNLSSSNGPSEESFLRNLVTFNDLAHNPKMIEDPNLVVRFNGEYYNWRTACPLIMSLVIYQRPLPQDTVNKLTKEYMPDVQSNTNAQQSKPVENVSGGRGYSSWFYWRRSSSTTEPKKMGPDSVVSNGGNPVNEARNKDASSSTIVEMPDDTFRTGESVDRDSRPLSLNIGAELTMPQEGVTTQDLGLHDVPKDSVREEGYNGSTSSDSDDARNSVEKSQGVKIPIERRSYYQAPEKYRKTLRLSSEQIAQLNLQEGTNEVVFSVTTAYQGTTRCKCNIYRWRYDDKIVISDIDGTITKSDVLGHILPIVGKDWAQSGVAQLFTKIQNNGYRLLYLSARAIGQARVTREYLRSIKQDDLSLPDGPLLLSPTSLMSAFHREVIERKPEEFKISCLRDIQALFPGHCKPFYAGYGNKINDVWAYRAVGIPIFRIFTINHRGELKHELTQTFQSSYINMSCIVDQMFPPRLEETSEDYSNFVFWREPIADIIATDAVSAKTSTNGPQTGTSSESPNKVKQ